MLNKTPYELSRDYYQFVSDFTQTDFEDEKLLGKFYTAYEIAESMAQIVVRNFKLDTFASSLKIIDPFCGDGRLVLALLSELLKTGNFTNQSVEVSLWDIDEKAVNIAQQRVESFCLQTGISYAIDARVADAFVSYKAACYSYDICVTNPPWSLLKPQKLFRKSNNDESMVNYSDAIELYDNYMRKEFKLSQPTSKFGKWGTNLARCGTEVALRLIKPDGICGIVSPASLLNDQVSTPLRSWLFENFSIINVAYYPAELKMYGVADISSITIVLKRGKTDNGLHIQLYKDKDTYYDKKVEKAAFTYIKRHSYNIPLKTGIEAIPLMMYFEKLPSALDYCNCNGLRFTRELDETRYQKKLVTEGGIPFAKGYMVDRYTFHDDSLFINEQLVKVPPSMSCHKVVWRDVSRDSQARRIKATLLPPGYICGNSLGVIYGEESAIPHLKMLLAIMNSAIFEYQARGMLVSNHVAAGIVKQIHMPSPGIDPEVLNLVDRQLQGENVELLLEVAIAKLYRIPSDGFEFIIQAFDFTDEEKSLLLTQYKEQINRTEKRPPMIYNHYASSLSSLDMQIIRCVPPGGNWKNIPESVPSQRLAQIRESYKAGKGSRSTYYGRLLPEMPAYTINTYFTRPGNGCHIHYDQDRTLSQREAARFQSFPDSFKFIGSLSAINNQIGNAVPPLLAYQIAKSIPFQGQFIDLFCGAGGLALGFIWAGWKPIVGNDIDAYAIETHKRNIGAEAIVGDINDPNVFDQIVSKALAAKAAQPDLPLFVLGGPPCQGFSTANTRRGADDMRNWLFKSYAQIVRAIQPDGFVFENVRGITNLNQGKFFEMIKSELTESVAEIKVIQVNAAYYGVPQRRDRVIILGGDTPLVHGFNMHEISCVQKKGQLSLLPPIIGAEDAIGDLPLLHPGEDGSGYSYRFPAANMYQKFMRGEVSAEEYLQSYSI